MAKEKNRYHQVRERPAYGDRVSLLDAPDLEGTVITSVPTGTGFRVGVHLDGQVYMFKPMSELVLVEAAT